MTLRNYVRYFGPFLSPEATTETGRLFTAQDESLLRRAASLLRSGQTYAQVIEYLGQHPTAEAEILDDDETPPQDDTPPAPASIAPLEFFNQFVDRLQTEHRAAIDAQAKHIEDLQQERDRLQAEIDRLRRPWWKKMLGE